MIELRQTERFARWLDGLRNSAAERGFRRVSNALRRVIPETSRLAAKACPRYESMSVRGTASTSRGEAEPSSFFLRAETADAGGGYQGGAAAGAWPDGVAEMKRKTATTRYDVAEHLRTPEEMAAYLEACLEEADGDAAFVAKALGDIARAKGMSQVAREAGLSRESLYKALSGERSPDFDTILKVIGALGLRLHAEAAHRSQRA